MIYICANISNFSINWPSTFSIWITNEKKSIILLFIQIKILRNLQKKGLMIKLKVIKKNFKCYLFHRGNLNGIKKIREPSKLSTKSFRKWI